MNSNNNSNGNHNNSQDSTTNLIEGSELGEVKIALGRLYKEFESFKQSQKTERERDRAELQAWAQTNLVQSQLLTKAMATIEILTGELKNQNLSSNESEQNNADLMQQLTPLLTQLKNTPKSTATLESLEFKGLKSEILQLKQNGNDLTTQTNNLTKIIHELKNSVTQITTKEKEVYPVDSQGLGCFWSLGTGLAFLVVFFVINQLIPVKISDDIQNNLQSILQRTGYSNVKLQRIEKRLGSEPDRK